MPRYYTNPCIDGNFDIRIFGTAVLSYPITPYYPTNFYCLERLYWRTIIFLTSDAVVSSRSCQWS